MCMYVRLSVCLPSLTIPVRFPRVWQAWPLEQRGSGVVYFSSRLQMYSPERLSHPHLIARSLRTLTCFTLRGLFTDGSHELGKGLRILFKALVRTSCQKCWSEPGVSCIPDNHITRPSPWEGAPAPPGLLPSLPPSSLVPFLSLTGRYIAQVDLKLDISLSMDFWCSCGLLLRKHATMHSLCNEGGGTHGFLLTGQASYF